MKRTASVVVFLMVFALLFGYGCASQQPSSQAGTSAPAKTNEPTEAASAAPTAAPQQLVEITIPHYKTGQNVGAKFFLPQVERFNKANEGKYKVVIEELTQDLYAEKIKQLGLQSKLPPLIEGGDKDWIEQAAIPGGLFLDLAPWLETKPELKKALLQSTIDYNTKDGKLFSIVYPVVRPMSMWYNTDMVQFSKAPGEMADWDELLKELGENKIAFMTGENAWTTALVYSSLLAAEPGGADMLRAGLKDKIYDYTGPIWVNAAMKLQKMLKDYGASSMVGAVYADAANTFMSKRAALIANGSWMSGDFAAGSGDKWSNGFDGSKAAGAAFPGNIALANTNGYGWWIPANIPEDQKQCALAFLEFMMTPAELETYMLAEGGYTPNVEPSAEFLAKRAEDKVLDSYMKSFSGSTVIVPHFADCIPSSIADVEFGKLLPKLIDGSMTPEQFCQELTKKADETRAK
jgi:raffinose/stachyose/melibiose transport system substrate-binding protein